MPQEILRQVSFNNGELDPVMRARRDAKSYYASLEWAENVVTTPGGPIDQRPGSVFIDHVRHALEAVAITAAMVGTPVGGTAANVVTADGDTLATTTDLGALDQVLLTVDFGAAVTLSALDLVDYTVNDPDDALTASEASINFPWGTAGGSFPATVSGALAVEWEDGDGAWHPFGNLLDLGFIVRTRRVASPPRQPVTAQHWRLRKIAGHDWNNAKFVIDAVLAWAETGALSPVRVTAMSFDDADQRYFLVRTDRNIEVYHADARVCSIPVAHLGADQPFVRTAHKLDTELLFNADYAPARVMRQGAHDQWDSRAAAFGSVPIYDYTGQDQGVSEVQMIGFKDYADGDTFKITLEGQLTDGIVYSSDAATMIANLTAALVALPNVGADGVTVGNLTSTTYQVSFVNQNAGEDVGEMAPETLVSDAGLVYAATTTEGVPGGEPIFSDARGWPACGAFYQGRLYLAGLKSLPQTILGSRVGDWFQMDSQGTITAINVDLDTEEITAIDALFPGQYLQAFTRSGEFFFPDEPIVPVPAVKNPTHRGIAPGIPLTDLSGATMFVSSGGKAVVEFLFGYTAGNVQPTYTATFLSKWANHLFAGTTAAPHAVVDMGFRRALTAVESDRALFPRDDGLMVVMEALREDDVTGFMRWTTQGLYRSAAADLARSEYVAVQRTIDGVAEVLLERIDPTAWLDSQATVTVDGDPITEISLPWLAGQTASLVIDGDDGGDAPVGADGTCVLPVPALRQVCGGLLFTVTAITLPAVLQTDTRGGASLQAETSTVEIETGDSTAFQVGLKGGKLYDPQRVYDKASPPVVIPDGSGPIEHPQSGWCKVEGLAGFRADIQVQIVKTRPGPLQIKQIVLTANT